MSYLNNQKTGLFFKNLIFKELRYGGLELLEKKEIGHTL